MKAQILAGQSRALVALAAVWLACQGGGEAKTTASGGSTNSITSTEERNGGKQASGGASASGGFAMSGGTAMNGGTSMAAGGAMSATAGSSGSSGKTITGGRTITGGMSLSGGTVAMGGRGSIAKGGMDGGVRTDGASTGQGLTIYYIRHAEVIANVSTGGTPSASEADTFTELGQRQVTALTTYLQGMGVEPDAILVSPASRAQKTIAPYLIATGRTGEVWMDLHEASEKSSTGAPLPSEPKFYPYWKATIVAENLAFLDPSNTQYWQNDTYEAGLLMVSTAKDAILARASRSGKTIFVVGHAIAGQLMIGLLRGDNMVPGPPTTGAAAVYILNTGVMRVVQDANSGLFKIDGRNINNPITK
jgi:broad specificity phosphatase PhoE